MNVYHTKTPFYIYYPSIAHCLSLSYFQIIVMICAYLGPLAAGLSKGIVYASSDTNQIPNWTEHLYLLGGLTSSVFALSLMLRIVGRVRTSASVTILLLVLTIVQMFTSGDIDENKLSGTIKN